MNIKKVRKVGSNGIKIGLIAENKADIFYNPSNKMGQWDMCACDIILRQSGGCLTKINGLKIKYNQKAVKVRNGIAASNKVLHEQLIKYTKALWKNII